MSSFDTQIGGDHYKGRGIQPVEYMMANGLGYPEGAVVKYVTRWRDKGGTEDLEKAIHFLQMLIEYQLKQEGFTNPVCKCGVMNKDDMEFCLQQHSDSGLKSPCMPYDEERVVA